MLCVIPEIVIFEKSNTYNFLVLQAKLIVLNYREIVNEYT